MKAPREVAFTAKVGATGACMSLSWPGERPILHSWSLVCFPRHRSYVLMLLADISGTGICTFYYYTMILITAALGIFILVSFLYLFIYLFFRCRYKPSGLNSR